MSRLSSLSLCVGLALGACDDAPVRDEPQPEPESPCPELVDGCGHGLVVYLDGTTLGRSGDGSGFNWGASTREALLRRVQVGLIIGGVEATSSDWPTATWTSLIPERTGYQARFTGHADLPDLTVIVTVGRGQMTSELTVTPSDSLFVDALVMTAGMTNAGLALGEDGFTDAPPPRLGAQAWLTPTPLSVRAARPARIFSDGRVERPINAEVAGNTTIGLTARWSIGAGLGLRPQPPPQPAQVDWGWRTGAAHGAVVDPAAVDAERRVLTEAGADPWIVIDGLWAPTLGEWRVDPALVDPSGASRLGVFWPAATICPDAPDFATTADIRADAGEACDTLNADQPAARALIERAHLALQQQGVAGVWLDEPAFSGTVEPEAVQAAHPDFAASFDRALAADATGCAEAAINGPFPRSEGCDVALRSLGASAPAPHVDPVLGARVLMAHLDLKAVSPLPLTLTGPAGEARQRLVLAALGGGDLLVAAAPSAVPDDAWTWLAAVRARPDAFLATPRLTVDDWPPSIWESDTARVLFNFSDAPQTVMLGDDWIGAPDLFDPQVTAAAEVSIPANDVRVFVRATQ